MNDLLVVLPRSCYLDSPCPSFRLGTPIYWTHVFLFLSGVPLYFLHYFAHLNYENFLTPNEEFGHVWDSELKKKNHLPWQYEIVALFSCTLKCWCWEMQSLAPSYEAWFSFWKLAGPLSAPVFERAHFSDLMAPCPFSKLGVLHALSTQRLGVLSSSIVQILVLKYFSHFLLTFSQALFLAILLFVHCTSWTDFKIFIFFPVSLYFDSMFGTISSPSFFNTTVGFFPLFCSFFIPKSYMLLSEWSFLYLSFN